MKLFTTGCLLASVLLCFVFMWLLADARHPGHTRHQKLAAIQGMEVTILLIMFCVVGAAVGAYLIVQNARRAYREEATSNMKYLLEVARADAERQKDA